MKNTKILCTIGPASMEKAVMKQMIDAGMNSVRINIAHGDFEQYKKIIRTVRELSDSMPIIVDIKGPELRIRLQEKLHVSSGGMIEIGFSEKDRIRFSHNVYNNIGVNDHVFIDNGKISGKIVEKKDGKIRLRINEECTIDLNKSVNIPGRSLDIPSLSGKDREAIEFAKANDTDFIALSFTRDEADVLALKKLLKDSSLGIIAKIENQQGVDNIETILKHSDGVMVARGDLGVEIEPEKIPMIQKHLIKRCNFAGKIVITATQMLSSMVESPVPTRAETSDVANAILDGSDCIMLSEETTIGKFPVKAVQKMAAIAKETESHVHHNIAEESSDDISSCISHSVYSLARKLKINKIVTITYTGHTSLMISRYRFSHKVIAVTGEKATFRKLGLAYGILPVLYAGLPLKNKVITCGKFLYEKGLLSKSDTVIFSAGTVGATKHRMSNMIQINRMEYLLSENE